METSTTPSPPSSAAPPPEPPQEAESNREKEMLHRTKVIEFLGRTTPIILQNDNGPCPLLAICNVLSLKNNLNLSPDIPEVSQEKLLSLVAERLIDSNSNIDNKDTGYVENQQQNISDAIDLLPRLTTGIDVNIKFRRIGDFEFTRECAIFDLLDIPLYHGWIVDPQDCETAESIGSKSYNTLMGELVSLETQTMESEQKKTSEDDSVDFVAATTAALGVPSPCLSRGQSFDESPRKARKGDLEEEAELLRALRLSEVDNANASAGGVSADTTLHENSCIKKSELEIHSEVVAGNVTTETVKTDTLISDHISAFSIPRADIEFPGVVTQEGVDSVPKTERENKFVEPAHAESTKCSESLARNAGPDERVENENHQPVSSGEDPPSASSNSQKKSMSDEPVQNEFTSSTDSKESENHENDCKARDSSGLLTAAANSEQMHDIDKSEAFTSSVDSSEPIYEGEERIMEAGTRVYENREPVYEGEMVLAEQVDRGFKDDGALKDRISVKQGELISNFLKNSASQLTVYGLFCLQDQVKERELCVFFRNNHFNTMFKYEGQLYILATDQGFINQPDLVWEKLNEVNGNTLYMTGNFEEFKMEDHSNSTWDERNAMTSTADYLSSIDTSTQDHSSFNSDLQLAIALQQQEFEQQQQPREQQQPRQQQTQSQQQHNVQQPTIRHSSGLVTGPQRSNVRPTPPSSSRQDSKSKEKCTIM